MRKRFVNSSGGDIASPLDASYYKGQGFRQGTEREYIVVISKSDRKSDGKRIQQIGYAGSDERYVCDSKQLGWHSNSSDIDTEQCEWRSEDAG